jgi:lactosylceramide 4-alpha-galactosyltransferase
MKHPERERRLTIRQSCAIESAALTNPKSKIFIIFVAPFELKSIEITKEMEVLLEYPNVYPLALNLVQFSIDTPLEHFIANGSIFKSIFIKSHTSDAIRLLLLWKFGGTYIDTDMIVRLELDQLPHNYICRDHGFLNGAIINLDKGDGRKFAEIFMHDMAENFNGTDWGSNGPLMLQRVLSKICGTDKVREMSLCDGFHVLPDRFCYPVKGVEWMDLFDEKISKKIMNKVEFSVVVHFWNKLSQKEMLKCDSNAVSAKL